MQLVTYCENEKQLELMREYKFAEVVFCPKELSRLGKNSSKEVNELAALAKSWGMKTILEWDIVMTQTRFEQTLIQFKDINLSHIDTIRVQDPGALLYCLENTKKGIQYICETGNHNLVALQTWKELIGDRLDRLVLSAELPKEILAKYVEELSINLEVLGLGKILLFYTPRSLLSPISPKENDDYIEATGSSEESPHKGFPLIENKHGTFMFNIRDQFLIEHLDEIKEMGLTHLRVDLRDCEFRLIEQLASLRDNFKVDSAVEFKKLYGRDVVKGYYRVNKSDILFPKLKNHRMQNRDGSYIGEVVDVNKKSYLAVSIKNQAIIKNQKITIVNTEGKSKEIEVTKLKNSLMEDIDTAQSGIALINFSSGVQPRSQLFIS